MTHVNRGFAFIPLLIVLTLAFVGTAAYTYTQQKANDTNENHSFQIANTSSITNSPGEASSTRQAEDLLSNLPATDGTSIESVDPSMGPPGTKVTLKGVFPAGSKISFGEQVVGEIETSTNSFTFIVPNLASRQTYPVSVSPMRPVYPFYPRYFSITTAPVDSLHPIIKTVTPSEVVSGSRAEVTLVGNYFDANTVIAITAGKTIVSTVPSYVSQDGTTMKFIFPEDVINPGNHFVGAYHKGSIQSYAQPTLDDMVTSNIFINLINDQAPTITSVTPNPARIGETVTIHGKFYGDTRIVLRIISLLDRYSEIPLTPTSRTSDTMMFIVPSELNPQEQYLLSVQGTGIVGGGETVFTVTN